MILVTYEERMTDDRWYPGVHKFETIKEAEDFIKFMLKMNELGTVREIEVWESRLLDYDVTINVKVINED